MGEYVSPQGIEKRNLKVFWIINRTDPMPTASPKLWYWVSVKPLQVNACTIL